MFGSTSTCSSRAFQRYHPRVRQPLSWLSTFESGVQSHVRPPLLTATLCPDRSTADPSCTPHMCRMQHNHPCIACRTHRARVVPVLRPEHTRTHRLPRHARTCGRAHVSGPGWRLPGCEETFFSAISTCAPASSQRCHVRVRLLPLCRSELLSAVVGSWNLESRHGLLLSGVPGGWHTLPKSWDSWDILWPVANPNPDPNQ